MQLKKINQLFQNFDRHDIRYCHWKSNEHLGASMTADTDLDVLFDESQKEEIESIFKATNFFLFKAPWYRSYDGIADYIGIDEGTGKVIHVHTHYKLILGETGVKSFHLPWEKNILDNIIINEEFGMKCISYQMEYLLLIIRLSLKMKSNGTLSKKTMNDYQIEADWLRERYHIEEMKILTNSYFDSEEASTIIRIASVNKFAKEDFKKLRESLYKKLNKYRRFSKLRSLYRQKLLKLINLLKRVFNKLNMQLLLDRRRLMHDGVVITIMGADGSGKSTQTKEITRELKKKVDVLFMYMGSGDGSISYQRKLISAIMGLGLKTRAIFRKRKSTKTGNQINLHKDYSKTNVLKQFLISIKAVSVSFEKKNRLKRIDKMRKKGVIVICDRYPQTTVRDYNDGPKLSSLLQSKFFFIRMMAKYEFKCYRLAQKISPDVVVKLIGEIDVISKRRLEMPREVIQKKQEGILKIEYGEKTKHVQIDSTQNIATIKAKIMTEIAEAIAQKEKTYHKNN